MTLVDTNVGTGPRRRKASERTEFWLYFAVLYPVCLVLAAVGRLLPRRLRPFDTSSFEDRGRRLSIFSEARAAAHTVLPFVFMA